jgi:RNA polymerase sigma factor (sigma-70 family)
MDKGLLVIARKAASRFLRRTPQARHLYEDAHAQALLLLVQQLPKYRPECGASLETYLLAVLPLRLIDWFRSESEHRAKERNEVTIVPLGDLDKLYEHVAFRRHCDPDRDLQRRDALAKLYRMVGKRHWPVIRALLEDRTLAWAGEQMGVSESRASQIRTALFAHLRDSEVQDVLEGL